VSHQYDEDGEDLEESEFSCSECDEELGEDDICYNEECPQYGEEQSSGESDSWLRSQERKQMGIAG
jgi:hypothetical protein